MLSYAQALNIILKEGGNCGIQTVPLDQAMRHITAEPLYAPENLPPFDNSAMDGFAVKSAALQGATADNPVTLKVAGSTLAGDRPESGGDGAWQIMTGAPVPDAYDAVIRIEDIVLLAKNGQGHPTEISIAVEGFPGKNIRRAGSDFSPEDLVMEKGVEIQPQHIMALTALGQGQIPIIVPPEVTVISTGKELVDDLDQPLRPGQIRNSNAPYLMSSLKVLGVTASLAGTIFDEPEKFRKKITRILATKPQIILSTGAVSMGTHDFVPDELKKLGAEILFHKTAIRPGKPILFARFPNGTTYFGLPGNPLSAVIGLRFFVTPLIGKLRGQPTEKPTRALLQNDFSKKSPFRFFMKAFSSPREDGRLMVEILSGQESFKIKPMMKQNCWAVIPEEDLSLKAGSLVDIYPLHPG